MPILRTVETIRPTQAEFGQMAYGVMRCVYDIHNEFGRFFDEAVYKRELASRMPGIELEVPVTVSHRDVSKLYSLDVLVHKRAIFEFKAAEAIVPRHRGQLINYLLLFDLPHGKVINVRPERVGDEFVNCHLRLESLRNPAVNTTCFDPAIAGASFFHDHLLSVIRDWGSGLDTGLYEDAVTHFLGGEERALQPVPVMGTNGHLHDQKMRLLEREVAFKITAFPDRLEAFDVHARRLIQHTALKAIHWANITHQLVTFTTIR
jgi:GxxExxY protein